MRELWHLDLGLGLVAEGYDILEEDEYIRQQVLDVEGMGEHLMDNAEETGSAALGQAAFIFHRLSISFIFIVACVILVFHFHSSSLWHVL